MMTKAPKIKSVVYDESQPVMDREQIDMLLMADEEDGASSLAAELFELYESESREKLESLAETCDAGDADGLRKIVHFIAGSAGNLGLARLSVFLRGVECAIDEGKLDDFEACKVVIPQEFELSCSRFRAEFGL
jgi:HPt (histidine-containing phosphotransfer) domain-containing protein